MAPNGDLNHERNLHISLSPADSAGSKLVYFLATQEH